MRRAVIATAISAIVLIAIAASVVFVIQGGFGGGHGDGDRVLFSLALPWSLIPWPEPIVRSDFVWLVALPFALNSLTIVIVSAITKTGARTN